MSQIAIALPSKEAFCARSAGAISLTVRDFVVHSAACADTVVLGRPVDEPFADVRFAPVTPRGRWFRKGTIAYAAGCAAILRDLKPSHIEAHNRVELFRYLRKAFPKASAALHLHNDPQQMRGAKSVAERRAIVSEADAVFCVSDYIRQRFLKDLPAEAEKKLYLLPNAMNPTKYGPIETPREKVFLFVGRIVPDKGALLFAQAMVELLPRLPGWRALIIGSDKPGQTEPVTAHEKEVIAVLKQAGPAAEWRGFQSHDAVMKAFATAEIVAAPALWDDPFPRAALEALTMGCAMVTTGRGGLREMVGDAALTMTEDRESLRDALYRLATDDALRERLQHAARERVVSLFDIRAHSARLDRLRASGYTAC